MERKIKILKKALVGLIVIGVFLLPVQGVYGESSHGETAMSAEKNTEEMGNEEIEPGVVSPGGENSADDNGKDEEGEEEVIITELDISDVEEEMFVGDKTTITVTPYPSEADTAKIKYESSDTSVLEVSSSGKVTAKKAGVATITARADQAEEKVTITVREKTDKISLNTYYLTLKPGETYKLKATAYPATASQQFTYTSTNTEVVTVSGGGQIKAVAEGYGSITVTNEVGTETVLVIVNRSGGSSAGNGQTDLSNQAGDDNAVEKDSSIIEIKGEDMPLLTRGTLAELAKTSNILKIACDDYSITIAGSNIGSAQNPLSTVINFKEDVAGVSFTVNDGEKLPGKFTLSLGDKYKNHKYLYLYNEANGKYQKLKYDKAEGQIDITEAGTYLLTDQRQGNIVFNKWIIWLAAPSLLILAIIYIIVKKRYWFW